MLMQLMALALRSVQVPRSRRSEAGQGLSEYALLIVLVAVVVMLVLTLLGPTINNVFYQGAVCTFGEISGADLSICH